MWEELNYQSLVWVVEKIVKKTDLCISGNNKSKIRREVQKVLKIRDDMTTNKPFLLMRTV